MLFLWAFLSLICAIEKDIFEFFFLISSLAIGISTILIKLLQRFCFEIISCAPWIYKEELSNFVLAKSIWNNKISTITLQSEGRDTTTVRFNICIYIFQNNLDETHISLNFLSPQHGAHGTLKN